MLAGLPINPSLELYKLMFKDNDHRLKAYMLLLQHKDEVETDMAEVVDIIAEYFTLASHPKPHLESQTPLALHDSFQPSIFLSVYVEEFDLVPNHKNLLDELILYESVSPIEIRTHVFSPSSRLLVLMNTLPQDKINVAYAQDDSTIYF